MGWEGKWNERQVGKWVDARMLKWVGFMGRLVPRSVPLSPPPGILMHLWLLRGRVCVSLSLSVCGIVDWVLGESEKEVALKNVVVGKKLVGA